MRPRLLTLLSWLLAVVVAGVIFYFVLGLVIAVAYLVLITVGGPS